MCVIMGIMPDHDAQIIKEYINGNDQAFEVLVSRHLKPIYNFVLRFCNNREEANDLTQEVFLKIWKNIKKFDQEKNFKTWIFAIARNTTIDWLRKKKSIVFSRLDGEKESFESTLPDLEPLPEEIFSRKELGLELEKALDKIPPDYKTIILLHDSEDMTFEEVAFVVDKPMNTVKSQYRRGLLMLREHLL